MNKKISIIIVNYNVEEYIEKLLESIYKFVSTNSFEIVIVDNNSQHSSMETIKEKFPDISVIFSKNNLGFSGGNNFAAEMSHCEFLLFLNPDTLLERDCINPLLYEMESNSEIGMITATLRYENKSYQSSYGNNRGILVESIDAIYFTRFPYLIFKKLAMHIRNKIGKPFFVKWISGAFIIMRKDVFERTGGFDISYPLNYEDMDLCKKVLNLGLKIMVDPRHYCIHFESKSQKRNYYNYVYKRYFSRLIYLKKYSTPIQQKVIKKIHIIGLYIRLSFLFLVKDYSERLEREKGFHDSLKLYLKAK